MTRIPVSSYSYSYFVFFCFSPLSVCLLLRFTACVAQIQGVFALQNNTIFFPITLSNQVKLCQKHFFSPESNGKLYDVTDQAAEQNKTTCRHICTMVVFCLLPLTYIPLVTVVIPILYIKRFSFRLICNEDDDNDDLFVWILNADAFAIPPIV